MGKWIQADSTQIKEFAYDEDLMELTIHFHSGGFYKYMKVPVKIFRGLQAIDSKGVYFAYYIKGEFTCQKL